MLFRQVNASYKAFEISINLFKKMSRNADIGQNGRKISL